MIDLQPGACLFSSKLHDFLKPKWHLLVEPEDHYFKPFIKPLLDKPGSTYRYTQLNISHSSSYWSEFQRIQRDPTLLPPRPSLPVEDPKRRQFDPSLLVIGNLARQPRAKANTHSVAQAQLMLHQLGRHALANQYFQNAGLVRMMLWLPEVYKPAILAAVPWLRSGFNVGLDMGLNISEAVFVESLDSIYQGRTNAFKQRRRRSGILDDLSNHDVQERMRKAEISPPQGRQLQSLDSGSPPAVKSVVPVSPLSPNIGSVSELQAKIDITSSRLRDMFSWLRYAITPNKAALATIEYPQAAVAVEEFLKLSNQGLKKERITVLLDLALRLVNIETNFKELEDNNADRTSLGDLRKSILVLDHEFTDLFERASMYTKTAVQDLFEDQMAFFLSPSLLTLYQRSYQPLKADADEFWPKQDLALFDIIPKGRDLAVPGLANSEEATRFCAELLQMLFTSRGLSLPQALDRVGVNAAKDLIPMVPAITDARKGGRLNPNNLRVRMVTEEMVEGLVKAFFEWPFRPQSWELALANNNLKDSNHPELVGGPGG